MRKILEEQENLDIRQMEVTDILTEDGKVTGVQTYSGCIYPCKAVVTLYRNIFKGRDAFTGM